MSEAVLVTSAACTSPGPSSAFLAFAQHILHLSGQNCKQSQHWVNILSVAGRLLAWATDIEAQLGLQRQELRSSRIELASAQEVLKYLQPKRQVAHYSNVEHYLGVL